MFRSRSILRLVHVMPLGALAAGLVAACDGDPNGTSERETLVLQFSGLEPLAGGFHYEGWAILGGQPVSTGKFNVSADGQLVTLAGQVIANSAFQTGRDLSSAEAVVITIEPNGDTDALPAATKYLGGTVSAAQAALTVADSRALGNTFASASGGFILAAPTSPGAPFSAGVWFLEIVGGNPVAALSLPVLPAGWRYEGWAVINGQPLTTGTFLSPTGSDEAAPFSGPEPGPPFPGEDFVQNAPGGLIFPADLRGKMIVISIEPDPDDSPAPFTLKPLAGTAPQDAQEMTRYPLQNQAAQFPAGTAEIR